MYVYAFILNNMHLYARNMNNYTNNINTEDMPFTNPFVKVVIKTHDNKPLDIPIEDWSKMAIHKSDIDSGESPYMHVSILTLISTLESWGWMPEINSSNGYYLVKYISFLSEKNFISKKDISQEHVMTLYYEPHIDKVYYDEDMKREVSMVFIRHMWHQEPHTPYIGKMIYSRVYDSIKDKIVHPTFHISREGYFPQYVMLVDNVDTTFYGRLIRIIDLKIEECNCQNNIKIERENYSFDNSASYYMDDKWMASMSMIPLQKI